MLKTRRASKLQTLEAGESNRLDHPISIVQPPSEKFAIQSRQVQCKRLEFLTRVAGEASQSPQPHLEDSSTYRALRPTKPDSLNLDLPAKSSQFGTCRPTIVHGR